MRDNGNDSRDAATPTLIQHAYFEGPIEVHFADLDGIDRLPRAPGWYAWIHVPITTDDFVSTLCRPARLDATLEGDLSFSFRGCVKPIAPVIDLPAEPDFESLRSAMLAFALPLYIGMARDLRARLQAHRKYLRMPEAHRELLESELDTDQESRYFAHRVAGVFKGDVRKESLLVKCIAAPSESRGRLKRIETILNRIYSPPYGRRA